MVLPATCMNLNVIRTLSGGAISLTVKHSDSEDMTDPHRHVQPDSLLMKIHFILSFSGFLSGSSSFSDQA